MQNVYIEDEEFKVKENENKCFIEDEKQADISELEVGLPDIDKANDGISKYEI